MCVLLGVVAMYIDIVLYLVGISFIETHYAFVNNNKNIKISKKCTYRCKLAVRELFVFAAGVLFFICAKLDVDYL